MVQQVGAFPHGRRRIAGGAGNHCFHRLLTQFLRDLGQAVGEQLRRVGFLGIIALARFYDRIKPLQDFSVGIFVGPSWACPGTGRPGTSASRCIR